MSLKPTIMLRAVTEITPDLLERISVNALMLDVDNTLSTHGHHTPAEGVEEWVGLMRGHGIRMVLISNNHAERIRPFAQFLQIEYVASALKPLSSGLHKALNILGTEKGQTAIVGDQLFTDVLGGNRFGIKTILLEPIEQERGVLFFIKRMIEIPFLRTLRKSKQAGRTVNGS